MKYFENVPQLVCAELGNSPEGRHLRWSIGRGISGLEMRFAFSRRRPRPTFLQRYPVKSVSAANPKPRRMTPCQPPFEKDQGA